MAHITETNLPNAGLLLNAWSEAKEARIQHETANAPVLVSRIRHRLPRPGGGEASIPQAARNQTRNYATTITSSGTVRARHRVRGHKPLERKHDGTRLDGRGGGGRTM